MVRLTMDCRLKFCLIFTFIIIILKFCGGLRLPGDIKPVEYYIKLSPNIYDGINFKMDGNITIRFKVVRPTNAVVVHASKMEIYGHSIQVRNKLDEDLYSTAEIVAKADFLKVICKKFLNVGDYYNLSLHFVSDIQTEGRGFSVTPFQDHQNTIRWLGTTSFEATYARTAFPCFDEPSIKATFVIELEHMRNTTALSSMPRREIRDSDKGPKWQWSVFSRTPRLSTYMVSFAVGNFTGVPLPDTYNYKGSIWVRPQIKKQTEFAVKYMGRALKVLENELGNINHEYMFLPKIDFVAVPSPSMDWAVENWGLVTFGEQLLMVSEELTPTQTRQDVAQAIVHELSHTWFGNRVTPAWWSHLWLKEALATFCEFFITDKMNKSWRVGEQFSVRVTQRALIEDVNGQKPPLSFDVMTPSEIEDRFDEISYYKGGALIRMMVDVKDAKIFNTDIKNFTSNESAIGPTDILNVLISNSGILMHWVNQSGYPILNVKIGNSSIVIESQEQFDPPKESTQSRWWIPLTCICKRGKQENKVFKWLHPDSPDTIMIEEGFSYCILNPNQTGYYRVNYGLEEWNNFASLLKRNKDEIRPVDRAMLLDDALNLAKIGKLNYSLALSLVSYLKNEDDVIPWISATRALEDLHDRVRGSAETSYKLQLFIAELMNGHMKRLLKKERPSYTEKLLKNYMFPWACRLRLPLCNNLNSTDPDLREAYLCVLARNSSSRAWKVIKTRLKNIEVASERSVLIAAMGCSTDMDALQEMMIDSLDSDGSGVISESDAIAAALNSRRGMDALYKLVTTQDLTENDLLWRISVMLERSANEKEREKMLLLMRDFNQDLDPNLNVAVCNKTIEWSNKYSPIILQWLKNRNI